RADRRQPLRDLRQVAAAVADVDADRELVRGLLGAGDRAHELRQQLRRQVVHAIEAEGLEGLQRHRLARAGHAGDDDQAGGVVVHVARSRKWLWRAMKAAAGSTPFARRMCTRAAASVSTARLRPAITGRVTVRSEEHTSALQ